MLGRIHYLEEVCKSLVDNVLVRAGRDSSVLNLRFTQHSKFVSLYWCMLPICRGKVEGTFEVYRTSQWRLRILITLISFCAHPTFPLYLLFGIISSIFSWNYYIRSLCLFLLTRTYFKIKESFRFNDLIESLSLFVFCNVVNSWVGCLYKVYSSDVTSW